MFSKTFVLSCFFLLFAPVLRSTPLEIPEPALENALCQALGVDRTELTAEGVSSILSLELNSKGLRDLAGLENAVNLEVLVMRDNLIEDLSPILGLANLVKLDLSGNRLRRAGSLVKLSGHKMRAKVSELQLSLEDRRLSKDEKSSTILEMSELIQRLQTGPWALKELNLSNNLLLGLSGVEHLKDLTHLDVSGNSLIDLEGVGELKLLTTLYAHGNQLGRVESFEDENKNKSYDLGEPINDQSGNGKRDTDPLIEIKSMPNLSSLYLYDNILEEIGSMEDLPRLQILLLSGNKIEDVNGLGQFKNLVRLTLSDNKISSLKGLDKLEKIQHLYLVENRISDLRTLQKMNTLRELRLQRNQFHDLAPIEQLPRLESLYLSQNLIFKLGNIANLPSLRRLSLTGNCLPDDDEKTNEQVNKLRGRGVFVSFGNQRKRVTEAETLVNSLIGHPRSSRELGEYMQVNGYLRFMDLVEDTTVGEEEKRIAYNTWEQTLRRGKSLKDLPFLKN
ncbi:MAG: hypothetical protein CMI27_03660 [Opitutae bacterium]|nr:hypothetical protein [Opitutae bacterium]